MLGNKVNDNLDEFGIKIVQDTIKSLGIIIGKDIENATKQNFNNKITKIKNLLNMWKCRNLSIKGKITVLRSQVLPIILYPASVLNTPESVITDIDKLFFDFIWPHKKHHVKKRYLSNQ